MIPMLEEALKYAMARRIHFYRQGDTEACLFWHLLCEDYLNCLADERIRATLFKRVA